MIALHTKCHRTTLHTTYRTETLHAIKEGLTIITIWHVTLLTNMNLMTREARSLEALQAIKNKVTRVAMILLTLGTIFR